MGIQMLELSDESTPSRARRARARLCYTQLHSPSHSETLYSKREEMPSLSTAWTVAVAALAVGVAPSVLAQDPSSSSSAHSSAQSTAQRASSSLAAPSSSGQSLSPPGAPLTVTPLEPPIDHTRPFVWAPAG
jgi:hypothetical protein